MLVQELNMLHQRIVRCGIECDLLHYDSGRITVGYTRVTKRKIA
jgi:hypothetical protein